MIKEYQKGQRLLDKSLAELDRLLDALEQARTGGDTEKVPSLLRAARIAMETAEDQFEALEGIRRRYWTKRAQEATKRLVEVASPLVEEVTYCWRATGVASLQRTPVGVVKELLDARSGSHEETDGPIPADPPGLPEALMRADRDACFNMVARQRLAMASSEISREGSNR